MRNNEIMETIGNTEMIEQIIRPAMFGKRIEHNLLEVQRILYTVPGLQDFISNIEVGQTLVLDISKEMMRKIQSGELKVMQTGDDVLKAVICNPNGTVKQFLNVKFEQVCNIPNIAELANSLQMANINHQLSVISEQLELMTSAIQDVLQGQYNDRIALYYAGEQLYIEAQTIHNEMLRMQLISSSLRSLEEGKTKMIESIKTDISKVSAHSQRKTKLKPEQIVERIQQINTSFDVINRIVQLKTRIYYDLGETEAMFSTLHHYAVFLEENINRNEQLLYDYDKSDTKLRGKWNERAEQLPQSICSMIDSYAQDNQRIEIDYGTLQKVVAING